MARNWAACRSSDDLTRAQLRDRIGAIAERIQYFIGVRAEFGRHAIEPAAAIGELEAGAGETQAAVRRIDLLDGTACRYLRVIDHLFDLPDTGAGRARCLEEFLPLARILVRKRLLDDGP